MTSLTLTTLVLALAIVPVASAAKPASEKIVPVTHTEAEWKASLSAGSFHVLRQAGTEVAFTGKYWNEHRRGTYVCAGCGLELFGSNAKFDSGTGWPSFWKPATEPHVLHSPGSALGMYGNEVHCARCGGHLGHVFADGPPPTGLRYCINSAALEFVPAK